MLLIITISRTMDERSILHSKPRSIEIIGRERKKEFYLKKRDENKRIEKKIRESKIIRS